VAKQIFGNRLTTLLVQFAGWFAFGLIILVMAEIGARSDDLFFDDVPFASNPSYEALLTTDEFGNRHGVPHARWKKVSLNNLGMRGPDVDPAPRPDCARWMFVGASETFGEPAMDASEYPARVRALVAPHKCIDVMNTAFPGYDLHALTALYRTRLAALRPQVVFVYPPTHFYLGEIKPKNPAPARQTQGQRDDKPRGFGLIERSRFFQRLLDSAEVPQIIQKRRVAKWIAAAEAGRPADWHFNSVPQDRLELLDADLRELIELIRDGGAEPVLMTHAVRSADPPRPLDLPDLANMRVYVPRASERILADFEYAAAERVRRVGADSGVRVIDVAQLMNGRRDQFIDLVHFTPAGHAEIAALIAKDMDGTNLSDKSRAVQ
jgi:hypothetical protein